MSDHERIWLQPECCADWDTGRLWCQDPDPVDCDDGVPWTEYIRADLAAERERDLAEALEFAERRSRQPGEGHNEYFERLADEFYQRHGYLAPGKSEPIGVADIPHEEKQRAWEAFLNEPTEARRAALKAREGQEK